MAYKPETPSFFVRDYGWQQPGYESGYQWVGGKTKEALGRGTLGIKP